MKKLHSPWRSKYIESFYESNKDANHCIFCEALNSKNDEKYLIVSRSKLSFAIMNIYPYNSGHLMIVPNRHIPSLIDLTDDEMLDSMILIKRIMRALIETSHPEGFNIGSNIGRIAGAGIDRHVHFHIVPRWGGDTNFMPVIADTKVVSEDIKNLWFKLSKYLGQR